MNHYKDPIVLEDIATLQRAKKPVFGSMQYGTPSDLVFNLGQSNAKDYGMFGEGWDNYDRTGNAYKLSTGGAIGDLTSGGYQYAGSGDITINDPLNAYVRSAGGVQSELDQDYWKGTQGLAENYPAVLDSINQQMAERGYRLDDRQTWVPGQFTYQKYQPVFNAFYYDQNLADRSKFYSTDNQSVQQLLDSNYYKPMTFGINTVAAKNQIDLGLGGDSIYQDRGFNRSLDLEKSAYNELYFNNPANSTMYLM